ncbi:MAG: cryptochrome/photolyase family protein [Anaerolineae bacterium]
MSEQPVIHWFRRDLRMRDNMSLYHACEGDRPVIALFIIDTDLLNAERIGAPRLRFLLDALNSLNARLQEYGTCLLVRHGQPETIIPQLVNEVNASALYFNRDYSPYANRRDDAVADALDIPVHVYDDAILMPPGSILKQDGDPYTVYTYFWKKWQVADKPEMMVRHFRSEWFYDISTLQNDGVPTLNTLGFDDTIGIVEASEDQALALLDAFIETDIKHYSERRNWLPIAPYDDTRPSGTSYLSPFLRLGLLSPRQAYWAARGAYQKTQSTQYRESITTWVSELAWREFYTHILHFFPHVLKRDFVDTYQALAWRDDAEDLQAWQDGMTGYPVVDAAMRQLKAIGWMPNRARMIVASFLTKDLLIHWYHGDIHFMKHLIDGDPAANNGGWQWAAGTGTDAQPYFRIFNPISQSKKYASPEYIRHWIPELENVPDKTIHEPWTIDNPPDDYPAPIVDHAMARERTLNAFKAARGEG